MIWKINQMLCLWVREITLRLRPKTLEEKKNRIDIKAAKFSARCANAGDENEQSESPSISRQCSQLARQHPRWTSGLSSCFFVSIWISRAKATDKAVLFVAKRILWCVLYSSFFRSTLPPPLCNFHARRTTSCTRLSYWKKLVADVRICNFFVSFVQQSTKGGLAGCTCGLDHVYAWKFALLWGATCILFTW